MELDYGVFSSCDMASEDNLDRVWSIIERVGVCMLTTRGVMGLRARPLEARPDRTSGLIWFVTDLRSDKDHEIAAHHEIGLVFIDKDENAYLSVTASAETLRDRDIAGAIWKTSDNMWWDGPDDPNAELCKSHPRRQSCGMVHQVKRLRCSSFSNPRSPARGPISARTGRPR